MSGTSGGDREAVIAEVLQMLAGTVDESVVRMVFSQGQISDEDAVQRLMEMSGDAEGGSVARSGDLCLESDAGSDGLAHHHLHPLVALGARDGDTLRHEVDKGYSDVPESQLETELSGFDGNESCEYEQPSASVVFAHGHQHSGKEPFTGDLLSERSQGGATADTFEQAHRSRQQQRVQHHLLRPAAGTYDSRQIEKSLLSSSATPSSQSRWAPQQPGPGRSSLAPVQYRTPASGQFLSDGHASVESTTSTVDSYHERTTDTDSFQCSPMLFGLAPCSQWPSCQNEQMEDDESVAIAIPSSAQGIHRIDVDDVPEPEPEKVMIILRGLPGSGKSTLAKYLRGSSGIVLSTDNFFVRNGRYMFDATLLGQAHDWNQNLAKSSIEDKRSPIVIDNTNTQIWEMKPYVNMAMDAGYRVEIQEPQTSWKWNARELARRNTHGVPVERIRRMLDRFQRNVTVADIIGFTPPANRKTRDSRHARGRSGESASHRNSPVHASGNAPATAREDRGPSQAVSPQPVSATHIGGPAAKIPAVGEGRGLSHTVSSRPIPATHIAAPAANIPASAGETRGPSHAVSSRSFGATPMTAYTAGLSDIGTDDSRPTPAAGDSMTVSATSSQTSPIKLSGPIGVVASHTHSSATGQLIQLDNYQADFGHNLPTHTLTSDGGIQPPVPLSSSVTSSRQDTTAVAIASTERRLQFSDVSSPTGNALSPFLLESDSDVSVQEVPARAMHASEVGPIQQSALQPHSDGLAAASDVDMLDEVYAPFGSLVSHAFTEKPRLSSEITSSSEQKPAQCSSRPVSDDYPATQEELESMVASSGSDRQGFSRPLGLPEDHFCHQTQADTDCEEYVAPEVRPPHSLYLSSGAMSATILNAETSDTVVLAHHMSEENIILQPSPTSPRRGVVGTALRRPLHAGQQRPAVRQTDRPAACFSRPRVDSRNDNTRHLFASVGAPGETVGRESEAIASSQSSGGSSAVRRRLRQSDEEHPNHEGRGPLISPDTAARSHELVDETMDTAVSFSQHQHPGGSVSREELFNDASELPEPLPSSLPGSKLDVDATEVSSETYSMDTSQVHSDPASPILTVTVPHRGGVAASSEASLGGDLLDGTVKTTKTFYKASPAAATATASKQLPVHELDDTASTATGGDSSMGVVDIEDSEHDESDTYCETESETQSIMFLVDAFPDVSVPDLLAALRADGGQAARTVMRFLERSSSPSSNAAGACEARDGDESEAPYLVDDSPPMKAHEIADDIPSARDENVDDDVVFARRVDAELNQSIPAAAVKSSLLLDVDDQSYAIEDGDGDDGDERRQEKIPFEISYELAGHLQKVFGETGFELTPENMRCSLSKTVARKVYKSWVATIQGQENRGKIREQRQLEHDFEVARRMTENDRMHSTAPLGVQLLQDPSPAEASAVSKKPARRSLFPMAHGDSQGMTASAAAKAETEKHRRTLHARYPSLSEDVLDSVFESHNGNLKACYKTVDMSLSNREAEPTGQGRTLRHPNRPASLQSQHQQSYEVRDDPAPVVVATSPPSWPTGMDSTQVYSSGGSSLRKPSVPPVISELRSLAARNTPAQTVFASSSDPAISTVARGGLFPNENSGSDPHQKARHDHEELQRLDKPEYRDYRAEAQLYWAQWKESMAKAREAHSRRNGAVAAHYSSQGHKFHSKYQEANQRAAQLIFDSKNPVNRVSDQIDLHGLHVNEAIERLSAILQTQEEAGTGLQYIYVVTGRGLHSAARKPKLKPAVDSFLRSQHYRFEYVNSGLIKVYFKGGQHGY